MKDQFCGICGSTFPVGYFHECPADHVAEEAASRTCVAIAKWIAESCQGWHAIAIAAAITDGTWREATHRQQRTQERKP